MNTNQKEKDARIEIRTSPGKKKKVQQLATKCNLSVSEYVMQSALGYEPATIPPDVIFDLYSKLCELCNTEGKLSIEAEAELIELCLKIYEAFMKPAKR